MSKIHIIGVTQTADLVGDALHQVMCAAVIIGSERQLDIVKPHLSASGSNTVLKLLPKLRELKSLVDDLSKQFNDQQKSSIVVLASGDPLFYGIGRWFTSNFERERLFYYPSVSSVQVACAKSGVSLQDVTVISLHGRPLASLKTKLKKATKIMALTDKYSQPQALARECLSAGFEKSTITVFENLGYPHEQIREFSLERLLNNDGEQIEFDALHVSLIDVCGQGGVLPEFPGILDTSYSTGMEAGKGMITKREVRLCILSLLQPTNNDVIWDVGAGCGGVAVELAYWNDNATVHAVECHSERLKHLKINQNRFGVVRNLHITDGHAPECFTDLPLPNKVFVGGSGGQLNEILNKVWHVLPNSGLLVVSAVSAKTRQALLAFIDGLSSQESIADVESVEVSIKRGQLLNGELDYAAKLPVEVFKFTKKR